MAAKRQDYFTAGVELVWEIDPALRHVEVFTSPEELRTLGAGDTLDGGNLLPGFTLMSKDLFSELDRQG